MLRPGKFELAFVTFLRVTNFNQKTDPTYFNEHIRYVQNVSCDVTR